MRDPVIRSDHAGKSSPGKSAPLAERLAQTGGVDLKFARKFIQATIAVIEEGLLRDGVVKIHQFGTFRLHQPQESKVGATINVPSRPQVVFQPDKKNRELVQLALGSQIPVGSRISLQALLEKHMKLMAPLVPPESEAPAQEMFDIVETFIFGEAILEPPGRESSAFKFDEAAAEPAPVFTGAETQPETLFPRASRRWLKSIAWYAGATAVFLLLLLFLLSGQISERQGKRTTDAGSSAVAASALPVVESTAPANKNDAATNESPAPFFAGGDHRVATGDNLWGLSGAYYRDHYLWPNIYRANTAKIKNPDVLQIDESLELPVLYGPPENLTETDRRSLAEGYFLLYRYYKENASSLAPYALWAAVRYDVRIQIEHMAELGDDDLAFLQAHAVRRAGETQQVTER